MCVVVVALAAASLLDLYLMSGVPSAFVGAPAADVLAVLLADLAVLVAEVLVFDAVVVAVFLVFDAAVVDAAGEV